MRILPGVLKELIKHVPTVLFEAVEWSSLAHELPKLSRRIIQKEGYSDLAQNQNTFLEPFQIHLTHNIEKKFDITHQNWAAERILVLYFAQLFSPHGIFLDLRPTHFGLGPSVLKWNPNGLWTKLDPEFLNGLYDIYDGFYLGNETLYHQGLLKIGLTSPDWPESDRQKLADLFKSQFGSSIEDEILFDLESFKNSLLEITEFMLQKKVKIPTDFMYLGIYLVTLYSALEKTQEKISVKKAYLEVREKFISGATR